MSTNPEEFKKFHTLLTQSSPKEYIPHYFELNKNDKDPATKGSWKTASARLSYVEALKLLEKGSNIGIAGTDDDILSIVDVDDIKKTPLSALKPTLTSRTSKRVGFHGIYFNPPNTQKLPNIATGGYGEVRSKWQYVVAAGSFVPRSKEHIDSLPEELKASAGCYTVEVERPPSTITLEELPPVFLEQYRKNQEANKQAKPKTVFHTKSKVHYKFFDLRIEDVSPAGHRGRTHHPLHESDTGKNWSITGELGHCWRHNVSLNAQQYLCVESGFMECQNAGTPHHNEGVSKYTGNDAAMMAAVEQAWKRGLCGKNDKVPFRIIKHIAHKYKLDEANNE